MFKKSMKLTGLTIAVMCSVSISAHAADLNKPYERPSVGTDLSQQQQQQTTATSESAAVNGGNVNGGNTQMIIFTSPEKSISETTSKVEYSGTQTLKNVPSVSGPQLTTSNDTCMGSVSASLNVAGFGVGGGKTYVEENCVMLKNAREFWNMGFKAASIARLCMDDKNKESLEITDFECPQTAKARKMAAANGQPMPQATYGVEEPNLTDPLARQRMGYKPLK